MDKVNLSTFSRLIINIELKQSQKEDDTLYSLVTEAFPIVFFSKKLEDNSRKIMEITECEILPNGKRQIHTLFRYNIKENKVVDENLKIIGNYERVNNISKSLQKRLLENGMPLNILDSLLKEGDINDIA